MRFSIRVQYGLQALLELALRYGNGPMLIKDIAEEQKVPIRYLEQLLLVLKRSALVQSSRGKNGGYSLAKHASEITLLEIIEAFEGQIELTSKKMKKYPAIFETFADVQNKIKENLSRLTLEDMVFKLKKQQRAYTYNI